MMHFSLGFGRSTKRTAGGDMWGAQYAGLVPYLDTNSIVLLDHKDCSYFPITLKNAWKLHCSQVR